MKVPLSPIVLLCFLLASGCQKKTDSDQHADHQSVSQSSPNKELYDEVMEVHDEVMPKMDDLYKAKTALQTRLALPGLPEHERKEIDIQIARIDSASEGMMVWMRQFRPPADSIDEEKARAYLQNELVKVKKVREDILTALETSPTP